MRYTSSSLFKKMTSEYKPKSLTAVRAAVTAGEPRRWRAAAVALAAGGDGAGMGRAGGSRGSNGCGAALGWLESSMAVPPVQQKSWGWCTLPPLLQPDAGAFPSSQPLGMKGTVEMSRAAWGADAEDRGGFLTSASALGMCRLSPHAVCWWGCAHGWAVPGAEPNFLSSCTAVEPARGKGQAGHHQYHTHRRMKHPALPRTVPMDIPGGVSPAHAPDGELSYVQRLKATLKTSTWGF